jgi:hypothetical protein
LWVLWWALSKEPTTYLLGNNQVNCFRAHKELTMDSLGKSPLAPSGSSLLVTAKFTLNNWMNASTKKSPFQIVYGYSPQVGLEPKKDVRVKKAGEFTDWMASSWKETESAL